MRAGACTVQQTLTAEAASVVKQAVSLARRRGHAQVTPLHVAATLLTSRTSLLRRACLKSHPFSNSHPLQCRALELCFNVALNRLPATAGPLLQGQPSLSNALVAALKRAQAHQRRGCLEQQQLAIKVELEQLIISILDDPSVSRVMREAGFSSTSVKNNLEDSAVVFSSPSPYFCGNTSSNMTDNSFWQTQFLNSSSIQCLEQTPRFFTHNRQQDLKDDFRLVLEVLLRKKRRNTVVVGDCSSSTEGIVAELMAKVERGEIPDQLKSVKFIKFQLPSLPIKLMKREDVESKIADLRRRVEAYLRTGGGAIIYVGDLEWTVEVETPPEQEVFSVRYSGYCYSPVQHAITELGRLLSDLSCQSKLWLMATANYNTYIKCQMRQPSLEIQWALQAVSVPSGGLTLSLHASSDLESRTTVPQNPFQMQEAKSCTNKEEGVTLICCSECASNYEKEARILNSSSTDITNIEKGSSSLPFWLQQHKTDNIHKDGLLELTRKWNRLCQSLNHPRHNQIREMWREDHLDRFSTTQSSGSKNCITSNMPNSKTCSASHPWWSPSLLYNQNNSAWTNPTIISFTETSSKPNLAFNFMPSFKNQQQQFLSVQNGVGDSNCQELQRSKNLGLDSFRNKEVKTILALGNYPKDLAEKEDRKSSRDLMKELLENIPWQSETVPSIAEALKQQSCSGESKNCFLILGSDWIGKRRLARTMAEFFFGSAEQLFCMNMRRRAGDPRETLTEALMWNPTRVVLIEEIDHAAQPFLQFLHKGITDGKSRDPTGREVSLAQTLFVMTISSNSDYHEEKQSVIQMKLELITGPNDSNDLEKIISAKRKIEIHEKGSNKKQFLKQSSFSSLDLNLCAQEDDLDTEESNTVHSDLTQESNVDTIEPQGFLKWIEKCFVFDKPSQFNQMSDHFLIEFNNCFGGNLNVDEAVLRKLVFESPWFLHSLFEKWLKNVFQKSVLENIKERGQRVSVRVCCADGGKEDNVSDFGYEGSSLPKRIDVVYKE